MTHAAESTASATLSGRELALKRRQAMALHGKAGAGRPAQARPTAYAAPTAYSEPASYSAPALTSAPASADEQALIAQLRQASNKSAARARREAASLGGKAALQKAAHVSTSSPRPSGRVRPQAAQVVADSKPAGCGCGCGGTNPSCGSTAAYAAPAMSVSEASVAPGDRVALSPRVPVAYSRVPTRSSRQTPLT